MKKIIYFIITITGIGLFFSRVLWFAGLTKTFAESMGFVGGFVVFALAVRGVVYLVTGQ